MWWSADSRCMFLAKAEGFVHAALKFSQWVQDGSMVRSSRVPVWADEDDEQVQVDIAGRDRLRKLRQAEDDASISGISHVLFCVTDLLWCHQMCTWLCHRGKVHGWPLRCRGQGGSSNACKGSAVM